jgi:hypothetical protein
MDIDHLFDELDSADLMTRYNAQQRLYATVLSASPENQIRIVEILLMSQNPRQRSEGIVAMMKIDSCLFAQRCAEFLDDADLWVRTAAFDAFATAPRECIQFAVPQLCLALRSETDTLARYCALEALVQAGSTLSLPTLEEVALNDHLTTAEGYVLSDIAKYAIHEIMTRNAS